jgi:formamidase
MVQTVISVDPKKLPWEQATPLHNLWHPLIPPVATVQENNVFCINCVDWMGGQIKNNDSSDDVKNIDLTQVHYLSGPPVEMPTAKPGDLLKVEFLNLGPFIGNKWGLTETFDKENGGGFLMDHCPAASKARIWDIEGIYCSSHHIPDDVCFTGLIHPGLIGMAPSEELLAMWNEHEAALAAEEGTANKKLFVDVCICNHCWHCYQSQKKLCWISWVTSSKCKEMTKN